jgi:hypothetical protein
LLSFPPLAQPLDIDYSEDEVVIDVVFRLKDLGDEIDGVITSPERDAMISSLSEKLP